MSIKEKTIQGIIWSSIERFAMQGVQFVFQLILARLLFPEDYGLVAMLAIFIAIAQTFVDSGFSNALIQKKDRSELDYATVFYFNLVLGVFLFLSLKYCYKAWELVVFNNGGKRKSESETARLLNSR